MRDYAPPFVYIPAAAVSDANMRELIAETPAALAVILAFSVIVYFTYELITTKKFKNLLTSIPLFLALIVVVPIATYYGTSAASHMMLHNIPSESSVKSINELQETSRGQVSYRTLLFDEIEYTDPELISIVLKALERTVENVDKGSNYFGDYAKLMRINYGISSITREVYFTESEYERVRELFTSNEEYIKAAMQSLPLDREISSISLGYSTIIPKASDIWALYKSEINSLSPEKIQEALFDDTYRAANLSIYVIGSRGLRTFGDSYSISSHTPQTAKAFFKYYADKNGKEYNKLISNILQNKAAYDYANFTIYIFNAGEEYDGELYFAAQI